MDATLGGRVLAFGRPGGRNWLWRNEAVRNLTDEKTWRNWVFYDFADFGESGLMNFDAAVARPVARRRCFA